MKRVLITGANSYIGMSFEKWMAKMHPGEFEIDTVDMVGDGWREKDFAGYDAVFHVAGIVHIKENKKNKHLYYEINRDLAVKTAKKAKMAGIRQFIFMSTMSIYGMDTGVITKSTLPQPKNSYGDSKMQAESKLKNMEDEFFKVCILRPPMIYGKECRGNFQSVIKLVRTFPVFPKISNQRSMIFIDNLNSFIKKAIEKELCGIFFPQNQKYMSTTDMACWIAEKEGKKLILSRGLGLGIRLLQPFIKIARKGFGSLIYEETEDFGFDYCLYDNKSSVRISL